MKEKFKKLYSYKQFKIILGLVIVIIIALIATSFYYSNKFYPHTTINGIDVSSQTYEEALKTIDNYINDYNITINGRNNGQLIIKGNDITLSSNYKTTLKNTLDSMHDGISFYKIFTSNELTSNFNIKYDQKKLKSSINKSSLIEEKNDYKIQKPVSAHVEYDKKTGFGKIVKETQGNTLNKDNLYQYVEDNIKELKTTIDLENGKVYAKPKYTTEDQEIKDQLKTYNMYLLKWISWDMGENKIETLTPEDIKDYLYITSNAKVKVNKDKLSKWIEEFCLKYKTVGKTRDFKTHSGKIIKISGGDYGWRIDYKKTVEQAYQEITKTVDTKITEAYQNQKNDTNKKSLSFTLEPIYENTAFKKDYTSFQNDWDTQNYSEIDLTAQKVYVYKNGKLAYSCPCVTGLPSDPTRATRTGVYYIKDKKLEYTLTGDDYVTPTKYWIRIMWTGTGYHFMNRSDWGRWSPSLYKSRGSHGCINLQYSSAQTVYSLVKMRDAVFIHY